MRDNDLNIQHKRIIASYSMIKGVFMVLFFSMFIVTFVNGTIVEASEEDNKQQEKVLFISSYNSSFPTYEYQVQGLRSVFNKDEYQLDIEIMDSKRFYTEDNLKNFKTNLMYKLENQSPYDIIIVGDDNALQFAMDNYSDLFEGIPVVFLGINDYDRANLAYDEYGFTGVVETASIKDTITLSTNLIVDASELVIISDQTPTSTGELDQIMDFKDNYELDFIVKDLGELTYEQLGKDLGEYDKDTIILLLAAYSDADGNSKSFYEYLHFVDEATVAPIMHLYNFGIGQGILGGVVVDYVEQGSAAGEIALRILDGEQAITIRPIMDTSLNQTIIDYNVMMEQGLQLNALPIEAKIINEPLSFFEENRDMVLAGSAILLLLILVIVVLSIAIQRQKKAEIELQKRNDDLAAMYEEMISTNEELETQDEELRESYESLSSKTNQLKESENRYRYVFDLSHNGMWERNAESNSIYMTSEWYRKLFKDKGYKDVEQMDVAKLMDLFYSHLDNIQLNRLQILQEELMSGRRASYSIILECCKTTGKPFFIEEKAKAIYNSSGHLARIVGSHSNITASVLYEQQLEEFAYKDQLTHKPNRIILEQRIDSYISDAEVEIASGSVLLIDVDNFKFINNTFGHEIGDDLLQKIAERIEETIPESFDLGRISGDEFVIIANGLHKRREIEAFASKIIGLFDQGFMFRDRSIYITVSIGISLYPENGSDLDTLLNRCNSAVHEAKVKGKNRYDFYDISMNETMESKIYIQNNIRKAIKDNVFELFYQPIYNVETDKIGGFEALIRWKDDIRGYISPLEFIVVAEKMGLINKLGEWVIKEAVAFIKSYNEEHQSDLYVSVNVSSVQLLQRDFVEHVSGIVEDVGGNFKHLCIELTETALMQSFDKNTLKLAEFRKRGAKISLDDFGTGYSSLNYLRRLPVDILKIDKSFVDEILTSKEDRQLTEGIIILAQKMGIYVIAEGIETKNQLTCLNDFKCNGIQGYFISRPMPGNEVESFIDGFEGIEL